MRKRTKKAGKRHGPKDSARRRVLAWDRIWLRRGQRLRVPRLLDRLLVGFVLLGDGWGWLILGAILAVVLPPADFFHAAGQGLLAAAISLPLYWGLKALFRRSRPHALFRRIVPRVSPRDAYSFPSGHTMNNLAIGVSLAAHLPALWIFAVAVPVLTGLLRVVYGVHFASDILAGAGFGFLAGFAAVFLYPLLFPG